MWSRGVCIDEISPRSYRVQVGETIYRRNRHQLWATDEEPSLTSSNVDIRQGDASNQTTGSREVPPCTIADEETRPYSSGSRELLPGTGADQREQVTPKGISVLD